MNTEYTEAFYIFKLSDSNLQKIENYIHGFGELEYYHHEFEFNDEYDGIYYEKYRSCEIYYPPIDSLMSGIAYNLFLEVNQEFYKYDLSNDYEFQLIKYHPGGHYQWHCDYGVSPGPNIVRKLSMSIQLTDPSEYEGGELEIVDYSNRTHTLPKEKGIFIVFDSKVPHRVTPVTKGQRIALVGWANGPRLR